MNNIYWGFNETKSKKRKRGDINEHNNTKKIKLFREINKMIYSIGNEIHFTSSINNDSIEALIKKITKIINKNNDKYEGTDDKLNITIVCDSGGGSVSAILKFVDFIKMSKQKYPYVEFTSVLTGMCASAATILCVACDHRHMTSRAKSMIHQLSTGRDGTYTHFQSYAKYLTTLHDDLIDIYLEKCNLTRDELEQLLLEESWFTAEEYLDAGFIDKII